MDISERVKEVIAEYLDERRENVCDDANIEDDLSADSMDKLEVMIALEEVATADDNHTKRIRND